MYVEHVTKVVCSGWMDAFNVYIMNGCSCFVDVLFFLRKKDVNLKDLDRKKEFPLTAKFVTE